MPDPYRSDVLVIGSGIAGLFYALRVAEHGSVAVVTKKRAADSATNWAQGGIAAVLAGDDSFEQHVQDTLDGRGRSVPRGRRAARRRARAGDDRGAAQARRRFRPRRSRSARSISAAKAATRGGVSSITGDATGREIERALLARVRAHPRITMFEDHCGVDLLTTRKAGLAGPERALGAYVLDVRTGCVERFRARITLLATGGAARSTCTRAIPTSRRATAWRWPSGRAPRSRTWSSCSSTRPASTTRRRSRS